MAVVIRIIYLGGSDTYFPDPQAEGYYIKSHDPDAFNGLGHLVTTMDRDKAKTFSSLEAAVRFYKQQSTVRPLRPDGKPNRPLTAYTISLERV